MAEKTYDEMRAESGRKKAAEIIRRLGLPPEPDPGAFSRLGKEHGEAIGKIMADFIAKATDDARRQGYEARDADVKYWRGRCERAEALLTEYFDDVDCEAEDLEARVRAHFDAHAEPDCREYPV